MRAKLAATAALGVNVPLVEPGNGGDGSGNARQERLFSQAGGSDTKTGVWGSGRYLGFPLV